MVRLKGAGQGIVLNASAPQYADIARSCGDAHPARNKTRRAVLINFIVFASALKAISTSNFTLKL
jgi:hypothetical protein